jgi:hypothetical protein
MPRSETKSGTSNRGFASMDAETQRAIASKGGKAAHQSGNAHKFSSEEAREAGRKGGQAAHRSSSASNTRKSATYVEEDEGLEGSNSSDQTLQGSGNRAQPGDQSGDTGYGEAPNEARAQGRDRGSNQGDGKLQDYQAENSGRNQGRNNIGVDQERGQRSSQGRSHREGGDGNG